MVYSSSSHGDDSHLSPTIIAVIALTLLILTISMVAIVIYRKRRPGQRNQNSGEWTCLAAAYTKFFVCLVDLIYKRSRITKV